MERREMVKGSAAFPPRLSLLYTSNEWYALPVITDVALWGGEQVMSLHPCVTLQRHRTARFSIRDTAYCTIPFRAFSCSLWGFRHQPHHPGATRPLVPTVGLEPTSRAFRCSIPSRTKALPVELCRHIGEKCLTRYIAHLFLCPAVVRNTNEKDSLASLAQPERLELPQGFP